MKANHAIDGLRRSGAILSAIMGGILLAGCSLWHDDLPECPDGADVEFVYDYNVQRADMFNAHVGGVTVFVFDSEGRFVTSKEEFNTAEAAPLREHGYRMHLDLQPGEYRLLAQAFQCGTGCVMSGAGAKFRTEPLKPGDGMQAFRTRLDREAGQVVNDGLPLDTLWRSMGETSLVVRDMEQSTARIPLMRITKNLHITLRQLDDPADISADDFEVTVTARNGLLSYDNSLLDDEWIVYTPWKTWTGEFPDPDEPTAQGAIAFAEIRERTANMQLSLSRLVWRAADDEPAMLTIRNRNTGEVVAEINLPDCLAKGRNAFELENYSVQEFLDRESEYRLDFFLKGGKWVYAKLGISVLGWSYRLQPADL